MRAHGLADFPDPQTAGAGNAVGLKITAGVGSGLDPNNPAFEAAQKACAKLMPKKGKGGPGGGVVAGLLVVALCGCSGGGGKNNAGVASLSGSGSGAGSGSTTTVAGGGKSVAQLYHQWAECMRQHGIQMN